jgi:uroporphyrinogen decarboxylase
MSDIKKWWNGPVRSEPDFENLLKVLQKQKPARPTLFEFYTNERVQGILAPDAKDWPKTRRFGADALNIAAYRNAGYDYATLHASDFYFPTGEIQHRQTISINEGGLISDWASFEVYPWPDPAKASYDRLEGLREYLVGNMKLVVFGPYGLLETAIQLIGFEKLCYMLADNQKLAEAIFDAIGSRLLKYYQICLEYDTVGAIIGNDDWGFKTQTMLSTADMRKYVIPWHKKIVALAREKGRATIIHSCGNLENVMDDIIETIGYDGKHSFEDGIMPVESAYDRYHNRIAIMGGLDVDFMVRSTPEMIFKRAKAMLERSQANGSFALGTGNSVPEYIPDENYFAMIAAVREH